MVSCDPESLIALQLVQPFHSTGLRASDERTAGQADIYQAVEYGALCMCVTTSCISETEQDGYTYSGTMMHRSNGDGDIGDSATRPLKVI